MKFSTSGNNDVHVYVGVVVGIGVVGVLILKDYSCRIKRFVGICF
jgi:hypothetical protein